MSMPVPVQSQQQQVQMQVPQFPQYTSLTNNTPMPVPIQQQSMRNVQGGMYGRKPAPVLQ